MEPEVSLPCSQEPSIGPYFDPDESSPIVGLFKYTVSSSDFTALNGE
jgi:hypothetical protein